ncbi:unnamed protein product [Musa acuminata subsp. malaccensis]|uniref:(wild Malaysian banana) hypothetical protein n=1 Tax=Musa acuminata subsp. malaccensis TaxID=214687 RepID=A0A804J2L0_MUSAM|nr:PREDICTED: uncharacterized protein LOC103984717 [Musa acuminata subsp. malaccensis]CAG1837977.1 unnamed protein product [Musa acuminata subsp. malaccensis]
MPRVKTFLIFLLLILLLASSSCQAGRTQTGKEPAYLVARMNSRKALLETTLDYDYGGANPKHDPKKGKPGIGGKP